MHGFILEGSDLIIVTASCYRKGNYGMVERVHVCGQSQETFILETPSL